MYRLWHFWYWWGLFAILDNLSSFFTFPTLIIVDVFFERSPAWVNPTSHFDHHHLFICCHLDDLTWHLSSLSFILNFLFSQNILKFWRYLFLKLFKSANLIFLFSKIFGLVYVLLECHVNSGLLILKLRVLPNFKRFFQKIWLSIFLLLSLKFDSHMP